MATTAAMTFIVVFAALKPVKALVTSEMEALLVYSLICTIICDVDMKQYFKQTSLSNCKHLVFMFYSILTISNELAEKMIKTVTAY